MFYICTKFVIVTLDAGSIAWTETSYETRLKEYKSILNIVLLSCFSHKTRMFLFIRKFNFNIITVMKKALLFFSLLSGAVYAQDCSKLFISEYVEGWSNNKALEIYNPTNADINLNQYFVARYSNGSSTATNANAVQLSGTVPAHGVFVAVLEKLDPNGVDQEAPIWDSLQARADGYFCADYDVSNAFYWNGNDAVLLAKGTLTGGPTASITTATNFSIVDIFGKIGENPADATGSSAGNQGAWSTQFPHNTGQGVLATQDHSMIRKPSIKIGVTAPVSFFNPLGEWDTIPPVTYLTDDNGDTIVGGGGNPILFGNWFSLGEHQCDCDGLSAPAHQAEELTVYPNPTSGDVVYVKGASQVKEVTVINSLGQTVGRTSNVNNGTMVVKLGVDRGVYLMRFLNNDGTSVTKRVVLR